MYTAASGAHSGGRDSTVHLGSVQQ